MFLYDLMRKGWIKQAPDGVIKIQNVSDYVYSIPQECFEWTECLILLPPFKTTWFEYKLPTHSNSNGKQVLIFGGICPEVGVLMKYRQLEGGARNIIPPEGFPPFEAEYAVQFSWFINFNGPETSGFFTIFCDELGRAILPDNGKNQYFVMGAPNDEFFFRRYGGYFKNPEDIDADSICISQKSVMVMALNFLHCKNVELQETAFPKEQIRARKRRDKPYVERYYTLKIEALKRALNHEGKAESAGLLNALHICRGHFKTFTESRPLFGRCIGTYWWEDSVRGSKAAGEVIKDYEVAAP